MLRLQGMIIKYYVIVARQMLRYRQNNQQTDNDGIFKILLKTLLNFNI